MNLSIAVLAHPQAACCPDHAGIASAARCRNGGKHAAGFRLNLQDLALGNLEQVPAVKGRAGVGGDIDGARQLSAVGIEGLQPVTAGEPDMLPVVADATNLFDAGEGDRKSTRLNSSP